VIDRAINRAGEREYIIGGATMKWRRENK